MNYGCLGSIIISIEIGIVLTFPVKGEMSLMILQPYFSTLV